MCGKCQQKGLSEYQKEIFKLIKNKVLKDKTK